jgi:preprotein translocase subunit YajC
MKGIDTLGNESSALLMQAGGGGDLSFFIPMAAVFLIFYFLVFRPQQKQQREREDSIKAAVKGDRIITSGGLHGTITGVDDDSFTVEVGRVKGAKVEVQIARARVESVTKAGQAGAESEQS